MPERGIRLFPLQNLIHAPILKLKIEYFKNQTSIYQPLNKRQYEN
jgi:hypothetical protein